MKNRLIVILLVLTMLAQTLQFSLATETTGDPASIADVLPSEEVQSVAEISALEWMSYDDFRAAEKEQAWNDPSVFIGCTAVFNVSYWQSFMCKNSFKVINDAVFVNVTSVCDAEGNSIEVLIADAYKDESIGSVWFKVGPVDENQVLPEVLMENPYVVHLEYYEDSPAFFITPVQGVFTNSTVTVQSNTAAASAFVSLDSSVFPDFVDIDVNDRIVDEFGGVWYDLGDLSSVEGIPSADYRYVAESEITLVPIEVTAAYGQLMNAEGSYEYYEILESIPEDIRAKFTQKHLANLTGFVEELVRIENIEYTTEITYNGVPLAVSVKGKIPETGVTLSVTPVSASTILAEGFDIENSTDIITALDIKFIKDDTTEWQPEDNYPVEVSIGMAELGYEDGKVFRFHHKHDGEIYVNDVFVVMDGKLTAVIGGFSMMLVTNVGSNNAVSNAETYNSGQTVNLYVGDEKIYYCNLNGNNNGTWKVTDTSGAIHYTVHSNSNNSAAIGNGQLRACWISIVALKETTTPVTLVYDVGNNQQTYYLNITAPKADKGKKRLYIKDDVNYSGRIVAALVDENGNEIPNGLEGASFSWSRDDGLFIVPVAYDVDYKGVNIARDHGGLTESKKDTASNKYKPVTYTVKVVLADGSEFEDSYTVYYQSEIINSGFEFPDSKTRDYSFFPNGYPELYWKTTAPGTGSSNITKDVEYGDVTGNNGAAEYTVLHAADYKSGGVQFAELNAEAFGALYQDIITVPHEDIVWDFSHAARYPSWGQGTTNKMYIVIGATEDAQKLKSQTELEELGQAAKNKGVVASGGPVEVTYKGANYYVWYHDADNDKGENDGGWFPMSGTYTVPDNQYRTRVFFVSDKGTSTHPNSGNLIDISRAGQYKTFLIEYYEETYENGELKVKYWGSKTEKGEALVYSSQPLKNFDFFEKVQYDYLHKIIINGNNYPYDIRYAEGSDISAALYIEKYPVNTEQNKKPNISEYEQDDNGNDILNNNNYADYEIVMQVYFRDTVIAVQKELVFPSYVAATSDTPEVPGMTEEQKLTLMNKLKDKNGGYNVDFVLTSDDKTKPGGVSFVPEEGTVTITNRDPAGKYKGYLALGENPPLDNNYFVEELKPTDPEGLILDKVVFSIYRYAMGKSVEDEPVLVSYNEIDLNASKQLITGGIYFGDVKVDGQELSVKIADVTVTNYYREKMTTIKYKAVGNGKVSLTGESDYQDVPTEELAYYSGKSKGVKVHAGNDATFVGWFKDEACTIPVENKDGVVGADGTFKPNANIIAADEITFYAKFATTTISIERTNAEPNQVFVYKVTNADNSTTMYVTLTCDKNGNGKREIFEVAAGEYTVTELSDLTWRYPQTSQTAGDISSTLITFEFDASFNNDKWLNGYSDPLKNVYTP